ncbi:cell differentiation protein RCD1-like protein, partial [Euroglyphus maynei]
GVGVVPTVTSTISSSTGSTPASSGLNTPLTIIPTVGGGGGGNIVQSAETERILQLIGDLLNYETREHALMELSRKRENVEDLAVLLYSSFGAMAALLQEIISIYPTIHPPTLNAHQSNRVCNALALLQCVASHSQTRAAFLQANIPLFLYPFLNMNTSSKTRPFEYLRLTSLGVIGALVKTDEKEVINFLLKTEIIPLCLRIMESGTELSKTVATFILQKILLDETGLNYICQTYDRFSHVAMILGKMVMALAKDQSARLLKHVIRCYLRLSDNPRAREALRHCLPDHLKSNTFANCLNNDRGTKSWLHQLLKNIEKDPQQQQSSQPQQQQQLIGPNSNGTGGGNNAAIGQPLSSSPGSVQTSAAAVAAAGNNANLMLTAGGGGGNVPVSVERQMNLTPSSKSNKM